MIAESLLEEGKEYSVKALHSAMGRIVRLPFILDALFSLGRGSVRGKYRLGGANQNQPEGRHSAGLVRPSGVPGNLK